MASPSIEPAGAAASRFFRNDPEPRSTDRGASGARNLWIAATATVRDLAVLTQDADYDGIPGLRVLKL